MPRPTTAAISSKPKATVAGRVVLGLFFGLFLAVGAGMGAVMFARPIVSIISARDWSPTVCEILSSRLGETPGENGPTYRVEVTYRYMVDRQSYSGSRYKFMGGSSSGYRRKARVVERLAPGTLVECFANPSAPSESVIVRGPTGDLAFGLIPLFFALIGGGGVWAATFARGPLARRIAPRPVPTHVTYESASRRNAFTRLIPIHTRMAKAVGFALIALLWNGTVSLFVYQVIEHWQHKVLALPLALFLVPFAAVGFVLIVVAVSQALGILNPMPHLIVNAKTLAIGDELKLRWVIEGQISKVRHLRITLEGREEATYRRGTDTHTDKHVFTTLPLVDQSGPLGIDGGTARVTIPADTIHSFDAPHNKIVWFVKLRGDVLNWPDMEDEFLLQVTPAR